MIRLSQTKYIDYRHKRKSAQIYSLRSYYTRDGSCLAENVSRLMGTIVGVSDRTFQISPIEIGGSPLIRRTREDGVILRGKLLI